MSNTNSMTKIDNNFEQSNDRLVVSTSANENGIVSVFNYNGNNVTFKKLNGLYYINMTEVAKAFPNKNLTNIINSLEFKEYCEAFCKLQNYSLADLLIVIRGGNRPGTWAHQKVALRIAQKLSPEFSVWVDTKLEELLTTGKAEIVRSTPKTYLEALKELVRVEEEKERIASELKLEQHRSNILEQNLEEVKPKAEYFDDLVDRKLNINIRNTAKEIHVKEKIFISSLISRGFLYRDANNKLLPIAKYVDELFVLKEYSNDRHSGVQVLITPKGRQTFKLLFGKKELE